MDPRSRTDPSTHLPMRFRTLLLIMLCLMPTLPLSGQEVIDAPTVMLANIPFDIEVMGTTTESEWFEVRNVRGEILSGGTVLPHDSASASDVVVSSSDDLPLTVLIGDEPFEITATVIPGWASILPPLLAIALALIFREVVTALFAGVWLGALFVVGFNPITATGRLVDLFIVPAVADADHAAIMVFTLFLGAMVGIVSRNGGTQGIVRAVEPLAPYEKTWKARYLGCRDGNLLRRLCQYADRREHHAADHRST